MSYVIPVYNGVTVVVDVRDAVVPVPLSVQVSDITRSKNQSVGVVPVHPLVP